MRAILTPLTVVFFLLNFVSPTRFYVSVGKNGACDYEPQFLTGVKTGDSIDFEFDSTVSDNIVESEQSELCITRDYDAVTNAYPSVWTTTIKDTLTPLWFYCMLPSHCPYTRKAFAVYPTSGEAFKVQVRGKRHLQARASTSSTHKTTTSSAETSSKAGNKTSTASRTNHALDPTTTVSYSPTETSSGSTPSSSAKSGGELSTSTRKVTPILGVFFILWTL